MDYPIVYMYLVSGFNPSQKYEPVGIIVVVRNIWKIKHVPNHQPDIHLFTVRTEALPGEVDFHCAWEIVL